VNGCNPVVRALIERMLLPGNAISDICSVLLVSVGTVLRLIVRWERALKLNRVTNPITRCNYMKCGLLWAKKSEWILYAYCCESKEEAGQAQSSQNPRFAQTSRRHRRSQRNCWVRRRLARLTRKATTFSKKLVYHWYHFKILVYALQNKLSYI